MKLNVFEGELEDRDPSGVGVEGLGEGIVNRDPLGVELENTMAGDLPTGVGVGVEGANADIGGHAFNGVKGRNKIEGDFDGVDAESFLEEDPDFIGVD